jgi:hypothetical protein
VILEQRLVNDIYTEATLRWQPMRQLRNRRMASLLRRLRLLLIMGALR